MKKILNIKIAFLAVASLFFLASCEKEVMKKGPGEELPGEPITFGATIEESEAVTKGSPITGNTLGSYQYFGVYTYHLPSPDGGTTPGSTANAIGQYMADNLQVYWNGSSFYYNSAVNWWPSAENNCLMFYAYYPRSASGVSVSVPQGVAVNPQMQITYEMDANPSSHVDLMYAGTSAIYRTVVPVNFRHALTRISFSAKLANPTRDNGIVKVSRLQLKNVRNKGTLTVANGNPGTWVLSAGEYDKRNFDLSIDNGRLKSGDSGSNDAVLKEDSFISIMSSSAGDLMVIPQTVNDMILEIDLAVKKTVMVEGQPILTDVSEKNFLALPEAYPWVQGKHLDYQLYIARDVIYLGVYMTVWKTEDSSGNPYTGGDINLEVQ